MNQNSATNAPESTPVKTLEAPLTPLAAKALLDEQGYLTAVVKIDLSDMLDGDYEHFLDTIAKAVTGSETGLTDLSFEAVGAEGGSPLLKVTGDPTDWLDRRLCRTEGCEGDPTSGDAYDGYCPPCADAKYAAEQSQEEGK